MRRSLLLLAVVGIASLLPAAPAPPNPTPQVEVLEHKGYRETVPGSKVQFDMLPIPGGTFLRGSPTDEKDRGADECPRHPVKIRPFWMGKCEVTWDEFDLFSKEEKPSKKKPVTPAEKEADAITRPSPPYIDETWGHGHDGFPVISITHHAAMEYCRWLSLKTGKTYRLPTEAEWEWACRAGKKTAYFFGDGPASLGDHAWFVKNSEETTHPVGKKKPNPWGLHDICGNVAEWCLDHYQKDFYDAFPTEKLTLGPVNLPSANRWPHVVRGGSYLDRADRCRSAARRSSDKSWQRSDPGRPESIWWLSDVDYVGFRVVCPVAEQDNLKGLRSRVTRESK